MISRPYYTVRDFMAAARQRQAEITQTLSEIIAEGRTQQNRAKELADREAAALKDLGEALLPDLTPASYERVARLAGFQRYAQRNPALERERERTGLMEWVKKIEADPRYVDRLRLRDPRTGTLTRKIAELEDFRKPFADTVAKCAHPRLERLLEVGYGTPKYSVPFYTLAYYADWKAGDEILERFPDDKEFGDVLAEYRQAKESLDSYDASLDELRGKVAEIDDLVKRHDAAASDLTTLDARFLAQCQHEVAQHVADSPLSAIGPMLSADPNVELLAKKLDGLRHQREYFEELGRTQLGPMRQSLEEERAKLSHDVLKYQRPKKAYTRFEGTKFEKRFYSRREKVQKSLERYRNQQQTIYDFHEYRRRPWSDDFLWWDAMTDARWDGSFIPSVVDWRMRHPGYEYRRDWDDDDRATAAAAAIATADHSRDSRDSFDVS